MNRFIQGIVDIVKCCGPGYGAPVPQQGVFRHIPKEQTNKFKLLQN